MWAFFSYDGQELPGDKRIRAHLCHPRLVGERIRYIRERFGVEPGRIEQIENNHLDLGGMIRADEPALELRIGPTRTMSCWAFQAEDIRSMLKLSKTNVIRGCTYRRLCRWPGVLVFISNVDCQKFIRFLESQPLPDPAEHREEMLRVLAQANKIPLEVQRSLTPKPIVQA